MAGMRSVEFRKLIAVLLENWCILVHFRKYAGISLNGGAWLGVFERDSKLASSILARRCADVADKAS